MTIAGGTISYAPPPTPEPITTIRTGRRRKFIGEAETRRGIGSTVRRRSPQEGCWTIGDQTLLRETATESTRKERRQREKERVKGVLQWERKPGGSWRRERGRGGPESSLEGKHSKINLEGQSLESNIAAALGLEHYHQIMRKLW